MVLSIQMTDSNNYIVYEVRHNGVPIYIGSGKEGREEHVRSGCSHNVELNKLFFTEPDKMVVTVIRENLSQEESLEMEKSYIQAYETKFNVVWTKRHKQAIANGRKTKHRPKSFRSKT